MVAFMLYILFILLQCFALFAAFARLPLKLQSISRKVAKRRMVWAKLSVV